MNTYTVTIEVQVHDKSALWDAAMAHAMYLEKLPRLEAYDILTTDDDLIDPQACLVMLLDPCTLPGAQILESICEQQTTLQFGDNT